MGRRIRCLLAGRLVEVTSRTIQSRFLLRPSSQVNLAIKGTLGRAQRYTGLRIIACVFLSNHYHLLVVPDSEQQLASFMQFLNTNLSKQLGRLHAWHGPLFHRRYQAIPVSDEEQAQVSRLRYLLEQGVKEGLVQRPVEWPGVHCVAELTGGRSQLFGIWQERTRVWEAAHRRQTLAAEQRATRETVELSPLPAWASMTSARRAAAVCELVAEIEQRGRIAMATAGSKPLGERAIIAQYPHDRPRLSKRSSAPMVHAASVRQRLAMISGILEFIAIYHRASHRCRMGLQACFPAGCFPPRKPFIPRAGPLRA